MAKSSSTTPKSTKGLGVPLKSGNGNEYPLSYAESIWDVAQQSTNLAQVMLEAGAAPSGSETGAGQYGQEEINEAICKVKESSFNKVTSWSGTPTDINYPSEKLVKDSLDLKQDQLTAGSGITIVDNQISVGIGTVEVVRITLTTEVQGVSMSGLDINVYLNGSNTVYATVTTDAQGKATVNIPLGNIYRLAFPPVTGCKPVEDYQRYAVQATENVDIEYIDINAVDPGQQKESIEVQVLYNDGTAVTKYSGISVAINSNKQTSTQTTDANGTASFEADMGETYTLTITLPEGKYANNDRVTKKFTADRSSRGVVWVLTDAKIGLFILADSYVDGVDEYSFDDWIEATKDAITVGDAEYIRYEAGDVQGSPNAYCWKDENDNLIYTKTDSPVERGFDSADNDNTAWEESTFVTPHAILERKEPIRYNSQAKLIKISTTTLVQNNGVFVVDIDLLRKNEAKSTSWASSREEFTSIPTGVNTSQNYFYDGFTASELVQEEGDERGINTGAIDRCIDYTRTVNNKTWKGFLPAVGQLQILRGERDAIDTVLDILRPNGVDGLQGTVTSLFTSYTLWACTQPYSSSAYYVNINTTNSRYKTDVLYSFPFFAL